MALSKALKFVKQFGSDHTLRSACNQVNTKNELMKKYGFNEYEFDDAINMQLVKCQNYDEAEGIYQIKLWFALF